MSDFLDSQKNINDILNKEIFFLVGTMKSGTTWLQMILNNHPDISCRGEGHFTDILAPEIMKSLESYNTKISSIYNNKIFNEMPDYPTLRERHYLYLLKSSICLLLHEQLEGEDVKIIGEKTPNHTQSMPFLLQLFPNAKFIHIIRDGRDIAVSAWFHYLRINPTAMKNTPEAFSTFIESFSHQWTNDINEAHKFARQHPHRYREYKYEALQKNGATVLSDLLNFLGSDSSDTIINQCLELASFKKLSNGRNKGEENKNSHFRKGIVGDWKNHFNKENTRCFNKIAGKLLKKYHYKL